MVRSVSLPSPDQPAVLRLKRLLKVQRAAMTGDLMMIVIGRCCVHWTVV